VPRLAVLAAAAALAAASSAGSIPRELSFVIFPDTAVAGERIAVRTAQTPAGWRPARATALRVTLYLVTRADAWTVTSRLDRRLVRVGVIALDVRRRGVTTFAVPALEPGVYTIAYWCPACGRRGTFDSAAGGRLLVRNPADPQVVSELRREGLSFELEYAGLPEYFRFFDVATRIYTGPTGSFEVWEFADEAAALAATSQVSRDGYGITWRQPNGLPARAHVDWIDQPHWFRKVGTVVLYLGAEPWTLAVLTKLLGPQFAGR
jgi:hypothetical protein